MNIHLLASFHLIAAGAAFRDDFIDIFARSQSAQIAQGEDRIFIVAARRRAGKAGYKLANRTALVAGRLVNLDTDVRGDIPQASNIGLGFERHKAADISGHSEAARDLFDIIAKDIVRTCKVARHPPIR